MFPARNSDAEPSHNWGIARPNLLRENDRGQWGSRGAVPTFGHAGFVDAASSFWPLRRADALRVHSRMHALGSVGCSPPRITGEMQCEMLYCLWHLDQQPNLSNLGAPASVLGAQLASSQPQPLYSIVPTFWPSSAWLFCLRCNWWA